MKRLPPLSNHKQMRVFATSKMIQCHNPTIPYQIISLPEPVPGPEILLEHKKDSPGTEKTQVKRYRSREFFYRKMPDTKYKINIPNGTALNGNTGNYNPKFSIEFRTGHYHLKEGKTDCRPAGVHRYQYGDRSPWF